MTSIDSNKILVGDANTMTTREMIDRAMAANTAEERIESALATPPASAFSAALEGPSLSDRFYDVDPLDAIMKVCYAAKGRFTDSRFPAAERAINHDAAADAADSVHWRRPSEIASTPRLKVDDFSDHDIHQGALGNCGTIAQFAVLAARPDEHDIIARAFYPNCYNPFGVYSVRVYLDGEWRYLVIDDQLPCYTNGNPKFARGRDPSEFWPTLYEKAMAKLRGSYKKLTGGHGSIGFEILAGGEGVHLGFNGKDFDKEGTFDTMLEVFREQGGFVNSFHTKETGFVTGHAYGVIDARKFPDKDDPASIHRIVHLKNPWGGGDESTGQWRDDDPIWDDYPEIKRECHRSGRDGAYWITFDKYLSMTNGTTGFRPVRSVPRQAYLRGTWDESNSVSRTLFEKYPHYKVRITRKDSYRFSLARTSASIFPTPRQGNLHIRMEIFPCDAFPIQYNRNVLHSSGYQLWKSLVEITTTLEPGEYWLVAYPWDANNYCQFRLAVYSKSPIDIKVADLPTSGSGAISRDVWLNASGTLSDLKADTRYPNLPDQRSALPSLEGPVNAGSNYGQRLHGMLHPPVTGEYRFWIASDGQSELWLSTDRYPGKARKIASVSVWTNSRQWDRYTEQESASIRLEANKVYYISALHKEGVGSDNLAVAWRGPDMERAVIAGEYLSPITDISGVRFKGAIDGAPAVREMAYGGSIGDSVIRPVGVTITFEKVAGPAWLEVASDGALSGAPTTDDLGENRFIARATGSDESIDEAALMIEVHIQPGLGGISQATWTDVKGNNVADLTGAATYPGLPDSTSMLDSFEAKTNAGTNYGQRLHGFLHPYATGEYIFWISSNNDSELWISSDRASENAKKVAYLHGWLGRHQWDRKPSQKSASIRLEAGKSYYIRALHKEGIGEDNLAVAWQGPDLPRQVIGGRYLEPFDTAG
uniref:PA14 domain-containing protein n=1 Tax=Candidatus Kentrum sp. SD TaxID=2126332 RepID=A0A450YC16_9GAMM|nr:MAG: PA14 domain-containing protein [Candidatus Kentron sp. SD]VFK39096.1 MAG: PA14 domain-containing protein [Candidatus Kentron sp. SD]